MIFAKSFDAWAQQHAQKGEAILLQRLLARRFGPLSAVIAHRSQLPRLTSFYYGPITCWMRPT